MSRTDGLVDRQTDGIATSVGLSHVERMCMRDKMKKGRNQMNKKYLRL